MIRAVARAAPLRAARDAASEAMADLSMGETFEILEIAGTSVWGVAVAHGLVGYVDAAAFDLGPGAA